MAAVAVETLADSTQKKTEFSLRPGAPQALEFCVGDLTLESTDAIARELGLASISFPAMATGVHRYPVPEAAEVAVTTVIEELRQQGALRLVRFVLYGPATLDVYAGVARVALATSP